MISIMILFKDIKLFWQSDSYCVLPVRHQGGVGEKRYISIKLFGILILTSWPPPVPPKRTHPIAKRKSRDRIIEIETRSCRPTHKKI